MSENAGFETPEAAAAAHAAGEAVEEVRQEATTAEQAAEAAVTASGAAAVAEAAAEAAGDAGDVAEAAGDAVAATVPVAEAAAVAASEASMTAEHAHTRIGNLEAQIAEDRRLMHEKLDRLLGLQQPKESVETVEVTDSGASAQQTDTAGEKPSDIRRRHRFGH